MSNLEFWNKYKAVPNEALKDFDNGSFKGTDINTMWRMKCLTDEFGMCGIGWYYDIIKIWNEEIPEERGGEILTFAEIKLYIKVDNEWSKGISGVGGNKMLSYIKSKEYFKASDEAIKMAVTDAIGNACRNLGIGADVYWENDKTKYTETPQNQTITATKQTTTINNSTQPQTPTKTSGNEPKQDLDIEVAKQTTLTFGKYNGKTLIEVYVNDPDYIKWLSENAQKDVVKQAAKLLIEKDNEPRDFSNLTEIILEPVQDDKILF